jgi:hypothetical protein
MRDTKLGRQASVVHGFAKLSHRIGEPNENRAAHYRVTDVELLDFRNRGDGTNVVDRESVAGVYR